MSGTPTSCGPRVDSMVGDWADWGPGEGCPRMPQGDGEWAVVSQHLLGARAGVWVAAPWTAPWEGPHGPCCADEEVVVRGVLVSG